MIKIMMTKFLLRDISLNNIGEDRDIPKRKLEDAQLAADDGSSKKMFLGETVSSASNDHVLEKETRLKQHENTDTCLNSNVESSSMERERNSSDDRLTKEGNIDRNNTDLLFEFKHFKITFDIKLSRMNH